MALATADIHVKIDPKVKKDSEKILKEIGISMSDLINITLRKVIREKRVDMDIVAKERLPENLRIETKEQLIDFLNEREQKKDQKYTSAQMRETLSEKLGVAYEKI
ncbi:type II toxin-antitoxin system RelB/DinJ family antitoxin [Candidatus Saccharibacteria bacterium]|nr:type II toxin-antitoxin system RelB/DinJ family antitoxin [Candidatus Saccharibacteria bacterium]